VTEGMLTLRSARLQAKGLVSVEPHTTLVNHEAVGIF